MNLQQEEPIFAEAFFQITTHHINQSLYFYYYDPSKVYFHLMSTGAIGGELEGIQKNLQQFIDEDDLLVNQQKIRMIIRMTLLKYQKKGPKYPFLIFKIESQRCEFHEKKLNEIHLYAKPEKLPYSAISSWETTGKIISVESNSFYILSSDKKKLVFYLSKGETIGGNERIFVRLQ
ncbi:MAG: hypothetical protein ACFE95_05540 [Candidatus Hodarchaeota archaeon]